MFTLPKRPLYVLSNKIRCHLARPRQPIERMKEKWIADFSKPEKSCFIIKPEISYNANLEKSSSKKGALFLGLKKQNCLVWLETEHRVYVDQIIDAHFRFDSLGGYCAAGIMFRVAGQGSYYLALISSKGYFRLDAVNNNIPRPLIGWTETENLKNPGGNEANLSIIAQSDHFMFFLNGRWIAETYDDSIPGGHLGFALVSYDSNFEHTGTQYTCRAWLDFLSVDSRADEVEAEYKKWNNSAEISAESRFRLAHSLAVLDCFDAAYNQIVKAWKQREELVRSVTATYTEMRTKGELLFAARMALQLEQYAVAEEYINACLALGGSQDMDVLAEKAKVLSEQNKNSELAAFLPDYIKLMEKESDRSGIASLYALLGHAFWNLKDYKAAAVAWDKAFSLDKKNSLYAVGAAHAFEKMGKKKEALQRCLTSAQCALQQKNYAEMEAFIPKLLALGKNNRKAQELAEKYAAVMGNTGKTKTKTDKKTTVKTKTAAAKKSTNRQKAKPAKEKTATKAKAAKPKKTKARVS